jgi:hypothetical protein
MIDTPYTAGTREPDAAFAGAAARFFELLKTFAALPAGGPARPTDWTSLAGTLAEHFEQWLRTSPAAGTSFTAAAGFPGSSAWPPGSVPLGPAAVASRDGQSAWELLMKLGQLQAQLAAYWSEIANGSAQRFTARLRGAGAAGLTLESALPLYELWVECAEEAYAATVRKDDFCRLQAELANTATALLLAQRSQAEALARAWGLPTREEADAMQRQIRALEQRLGEREQKHRGAAVRKASPRAKPAPGRRGQPRRRVRGTRR